MRTLIVTILLLFTTSIALAENDVTSRITRNIGINHNLVVNSDSIGAFVYIDSSPVGMIDSTGKVNLIVDPGEHVLHLELTSNSGRKSQSERKRIFLAEGNLTNIDINIVTKSNIKKNVTNENWTTLDRYKVSKGLAVDLTTRLMWMRCSVGQTWNGGMCENIPAKLSYESAKKISINSDYRKYSDWRLPTHEELLEIIDCGSGKLGRYRNTGALACKGDEPRPAVNKSIFPITGIDFNDKNTATWTTTEKEDNYRYSRCVYLWFGSSMFCKKSEENYVRLVRKYLTN